MRNIHLTIIIIILASFAIGLYYYPQLPDQMASHWNSQGQVNGYLPKFWGLFLMPMITLAMYLLFLIIPKIDPLKKNVAKFRNYFDWFMLLMIFFLFYIYALSLAWNLNYQFNMTLMIVPAVAILFYFVGVLLQHSKRNWFIGLRTPWTMSSDAVWDKTNQLGGKLFKAFSIIILLSLFYPNYMIWLILVPVIGLSLFLVIYSYLEFRKEKRA